MSFRRILLLAALVTGVAGPSAAARAGSYIYNFGSVLKGSTPGSASTPWLTAEFKDVAPGKVEMTFTASHLMRRENVKGFLLNLDPAFNPCLLVFNQINTAGSFRSPRISVGENAFKAGAAGRFDLRFQFGGNSKLTRQFNAGDQVSYLITGIPGLTASSFDFTSLTLRGQDPFSAIAKVRGIGPCDGAAWVYPADGFVPVPEPSPTLLVGAVFAALGTMRWLRRGRR